VQAIAESSWAPCEWADFTAADADELARLVSAFTAKHSEAGAQAVAFAFRPDEADERSRELGHYLAERLSNMLSDAPAPLGLLSTDCPECGAAEGALHGLGCGREPCPFCDWPALSCDHCYSEKTDRPRKRFLEAREPHVFAPCFCRRCLRPFPGMFVVPDEEWAANVPRHLRGDVLCRDCYDLLAAWAKDARAAKAGEL